MNRKKVATRLAATLSVGIFALALWALSRSLQEYRAADILGVIRSMPLTLILASVLLSLASYVALAGFDWLGSRYMKRPLSWRRILFGSFLAHAISHNTGFAALTGGSIRYRIYSGAGLTLLDVGGLIAFAGLTFSLGALALSSQAMLTEPVFLARVLGFPPFLVTLLGLLGLGLVGGYFIWGWLAERPLQIWKWRIPVPGPKLGLAQLSMAVVDLVLASAALYILLPAGAEIAFPTFVGIYVIANVAGAVSHVPGGLGVFETVVILLVPEASPGALLASLLVFRAGYNLLPLLAAPFLLAAYEVREAKARANAVHSLRKVAEAMAPPLASVLVLGAVLTLVLSLATPSARVSLNRLEAYLPLSLVEAAHLAAGICAILLLLLIQGLGQRKRASWAVALVLLAGGALFILVKGLTWSPALVLLAIAGLLACTAAVFDQPGPPLPRHMEMPWLALLWLVVVGSMWLTDFAFRPRDWVAEMSIMSHRAETGRALRTQMLLLFLASAVSLWRLSLTLGEGRDGRRV
ncbi:lysylphosphatidylglycerol synthetase family protein [Telmatospirillum sp. J64-1]|uniref:lysylphosphatidylglycerol synthetase family protein n=1 Tax=Telmatospirillum sp. J64-1 TaxID=2502183 RepID=UPI00115DC27F|nr:lysylphosphatidylglycerol synthetase family protein [Telmatospirillum sp. J64-1]